MIEQLNLTLWSWIESIRLMRKAVIWPPFLLLLAINLLGLLLLTQFHAPLVSWFMVPLLRVLAGPGALHYPGLFLDLPVLISQANIAIDILLGAWMFGTAWLIAWKLATNVDPRGSRGEARRAYAKLVLLRLPITLLPVVFSLLLPLLLPERAEGGFGPTAQRIQRFGTFFFAVLVESAFLFGPAALLLGGRSLKGAFADAFRMLGRVPLAIFLAVLAPNSLNFLVGFAVRRRETIIMRMAPEVMALVALAAVVVYTFASFFVIGAGVRIWGARGVRQEGGR
jgi:hypothetical protein